MKFSNHSLKLGQLVHLILVLAGVLLMAPVVKATWVYGKVHHPLVTLAFILLLTASILLGSKQRRGTALHFIHQVFHLENLLMVEGVEAAMLEERENRNAETRPLDFWR